MLVVFSMSDTSGIVSLKRMDVLRCHLTARQAGQFSPWRTGQQPVGGEWAVAWARGRHRRHRRPVTPNGPPNHVVNGDASISPSGKNWMLQTRLD